MLKFGLRTVAVILFVISGYFLVAALPSLSLRVANSIVNGNNSVKVVALADEFDNPTTTNIARSNRAFFVATATSTEVVTTPSLEMKVPIYSHSQSAIAYANLSTRYFN